MATFLKNDPIVLDLSNPSNLTVEKVSDGSKGFEIIKKIILPARLNNLGKYLRDEDQFIVGEIPLPLEAEGLKGKISIESVSQEHPMISLSDGFLDQIEVTFDAEAVNSLFPEGLIQIRMRSDLYATPDSDADENNPKAFEIEREEEAADIICSQTILFENEDGEAEEMEYFVLPDQGQSDFIYPTSAELEGDSHWAFTSGLEKRPDGQAGNFFEKRIRFTFRIFKRNKLKREVKRFIKKFISEHPDHGLSKEAFIDLVITKLKENNEIIPFIQQAYSIGIYDTAAKRLVEVNKHHRIDPTLKTLILVPGTFKKSIEATFLLDGSVIWDGSFKYLMEPTKGEKNWFEFLLKNTEYRQIISLEHDSTVDSLDDNIRFFLAHFKLGELKFEQPTTLISASRGGFLAKKLALVDAGKDPAFAPGVLHLNVERIITVANGFTGYLEQDNQDKMKRIMEFIFSLLKVGRFEAKGQTAWLFSLSPEFIFRLPGLLQQTRGSAELIPVLNQHLANLWCLPLANKCRLKLPHPIVALIDSILGPENDTVLSFESQKEFSPGNLLAPFGQILGKRPHGKGLMDLDTRLRLIDFLNTGVV